jgi:steroid delta-isomerase-like uncharacterized protein
MIGAAMAELQADTDANKQLSTRRFEEIWNRGNLDAVHELLAPDFVFHTPASPEPVRSPEGYRDFVSAMRDAFPDVETRIETMLAERDLVSLRVSMRMTHLGPYQGIPATGKAIRATQNLIDRIEGGKIAESWQEVNAVGMLEQLGVVPPRGAGPLRMMGWMFATMGRLGYLQMRSRFGSRRS